MITTATPNHALQRTVPRVTGAAISGSCPSRPVVPLSYVRCLLLRATFAATAPRSAVAELGVVRRFCAHSMKIAFLAFLFSVAPLVWSADKDAAEPFTLAVVPSQRSPHERYIIMSANSPEEFYVVLTNTSKDAQAVFESWNSWGYQNVFFEFTTPAGKRVVVSKRPHDFSWDTPSTILIPPGEHQVYAIRLDKRWETRPVLTADAEMQITLRAIYQVTADPKATQHKVWIGRVESKIYNLNLNLRH